MDAIFFDSPEAFRKWLKKNHQKEKELIVGFYKVHTKQPSMTWSESVDQALCFGWIDGVRHTIDKDRYQIRFTPRRLTSIWSAVNIKKIKELTKKGLMMPAGIASYKNRKVENSKGYGSEDKEATFSPDLE
jgi:uncharacterized protein YdeI (YjbR/CyaY-like superfamily)